VHIQIVNINGLVYTKNLVDDVLAQTHPYWLRLIDQNSREKGTREYFESLKRRYARIEIVFNSSNVDLNRLWNDFYHTAKSEYVCFLNNDMRIPSNFVKDTMEIFNREPKVGCVIHSTNHEDYREVTPLKYIVLENKYAQGWDFTMRREAFTPIPEELRVFGGDDHLFMNMYKNGWRTAIAISSPVIHYNAQSRRYVNWAYRKADAEYFKDRGIKRLSYRCPYTKWVPHFDKIIERRGAI
jgi:GT2 family glycosyltransferase